MLFLILIVVFFSLAVLLWLGTLGIQNLIYNEPTTELFWRAPATAGALTAFLGLWCMLDYSSQDPNEVEVPYDTLFRFAPRESREADQLHVEYLEEVPFQRPAAGGNYVNQKGQPWDDDIKKRTQAIFVAYEEFYVGGKLLERRPKKQGSTPPAGAGEAQPKIVRERLNPLAFPGDAKFPDTDQFSAKVVSEKPTLFKKQTTGKGSVEYRTTADEPWRRETPDQKIPRAILLDDKGKEMRFETRLTPDFKFPPGGENFPVYYQVGGRRVMEQLGKVTVFRWGQLFVNLFLNLLHFGLWFVCLWLLLRFQWPHALGFAVILWLTMTLVPLPMLLDKTRELSRQRVASPRVATATDKDRSGEPSYLDTLGSIPTA